MEGYPGHLGRLGAGGILKEAGRLLSKHVRLLLPFILAFSLPAVAIQVLNFIGTSLPPPPPPPPPHPHPHFQLHPPAHGQTRMLLQTVHALFQSSAQTKAEQAVDVSHGGAPCAPPFPPMPPPPPLPILIAVVVGGILLWVLVSLALAAFCKVVEYIYSDAEADDNITSKVFKSLPHALLRMFITALWVLLATVLLTVAISIPFGLLTALIHPENPLIFFLLNSLPQLIGLFVLGLLLMLSQQVAILEPENYGLAALKKSTQLVKSKVVTVLLILLLSAVVGVAVDQLVILVAVGGDTGRIPSWTVPIFWIIIGLAFLAWTVYISLATVVLYFSCKTEFEAQNGGLPEYTTNSGNQYAPLVHSAE